MNEQGIMKQIMLRIGEAFPKSVRIFRNNTGMGWTGESFSHPGKVIIKNARPLHAGLCKGSSDLIGWTKVQITPDMIGKTVAVFTAFEVKKPEGRVSKDQVNFLTQVAESGGLSGILRSPEDAERIIKTRLIQ